LNVAFGADHPAFRRPVALSGLGPFLPPASSPQLARASLSALPRPCGVSCRFARDRPL